MRARALGFLLILLSLAACGGSDPQSTPTTPTTTESESPSPTPCPTLAEGPVQLCGVVNDKGTVDVTDQGASVALTVTSKRPSFAFEPTFVKSEPGAEVTVTYVNAWDGTGTETIHSFTISSLEVDVVARAGETKELTFTLPTDEPFVNFTCTVASGGHLRSGMQGAFYFS